VRHGAILETDIEAWSLPVGRKNTGGKTAGVTAQVEVVGEFPARRESSSPGLPG